MKDDPKLRDFRGTDRGGEESCPVSRRRQTTDDTRTLQVNRGEGWRLVKLVMERGKAKESHQSATPVLAVPWALNTLRLPLPLAGNHYSGLPVHAVNTGTVGTLQETRYGKEEAKRRGIGKC